MSQQRVEQGRIGEYVDSVNRGAKMDILIDEYAERRGHMNKQSAGRLPAVVDCSC